MIQSTKIEECVRMAELGQIKSKALAKLDSMQTMTSTKEIADAELAELSVLVAFDKDKLKTLIVRVIVYDSDEVEALLDKSRLLAPIFETCPPYKTRQHSLQAMPSCDHEITSLWGAFTGVLYLFQSQWHQESSEGNQNPSPAARYRTNWK